jgi:lipopolysaccharide export system protein LptA
MSRRLRAAGAGFAALVLTVAAPAPAQQLDLTRGGPIDITARDGIEWRQMEQQVIARGDAKAIRGNVTVTAARLTAWYRKKKSSDGVAPAPQPTAGLAGDTATDGSEIYRLQAEGNVHIFTQTDQAQGDRATYDLDQAVMVMTGHDLRLTTPNNVITARDDLEYWPQKHMAVARGDAVVVTSDAKRLGADTLVAYTTPNDPVEPAAAGAGRPRSDDPLGASGKLEKVEAFGHVSVRTQTDTVTGERGVYVPESGIARLAGNVQINRGQNQLNGAAADVNMKTGVATLVSSRSDRVHGLVVPNDSTNKGLGDDPAATPRKPPSPPTPAAAQPSGKANP